MRFEAGTPPIAEAVGLHAALDFIDSLGREQIEAYEHELTQYALERLQEVPGLKLYGPQPDRCGHFRPSRWKISTPTTFATILDSRDIAIRSGMHCAHPLGDRLGQKSTARASLAVYNDTEHIDRLVEGLHYVRQVFGYAG
ncbi:MAG: hypothetical protein KatS3mg021_1376 [Fimbriimonadales bacterium]|nr:MAG: hypothetical protein KatS3mg021_1376 [Fimbriimonadales bacterium]